MGACDDPALAYELAAPGGIAAPDDVKVPPARGTQPFDPFDQGAGIATVGPDDLHSAKEKVEARPQGHGPVPVRDREGAVRGCAIRRR